MESSPESKHAPSESSKNENDPARLASIYRGSSDDFLSLSVHPSSSSTSSSSTSRESLSVPSSQMSIEDPAASLEGSLEVESDSNLFPPSQLPVIAESTFMWNIECWDQLPKKVVGHTFQVGNYAWSLLMLKDARLLGYYLALHTLERSVCVDLIFEALSPDGKEYHRRGTSHRFSVHDFIDLDGPPDWGFKNFISLEVFEGKLVQRNAVHLNVHIRLLRDSQSFNYASHMVGWSVSSVDPHLPRDPRVEKHSEPINERIATGFLGLHNQGATCYMNSILQSLFLTNSFRKSLLKVPTKGHKPHDSIPLALQRIFWQLQFGMEPPNTNELTDSFGWDTVQAFTQHDVQEFLRALLDDLEEKMKGTPSEGSIERLFVAKVGQFVQCLRVSYESVRQDTLYDIQLPIFGCKTLTESLDRFIAPEYLEGANKYNAEGHGLQDAKMFSMFTKLPPVLHLILMRYRYDPLTDQTVKINDRFEFPDALDMRPYVKDAVGSEDYTYILHSVLVHSGDLHGGHYCAFIKDFGKNEWFKFDDTLVSKVAAHEAIEENFGEDSVTTIAESSIDLASQELGSSVRTRRRRNVKRITNAYMLVYVRTSEVKKVLDDVVDGDYDPSIGPTIQAELEAERRKTFEERESKLTMQIAWLTWQDICGHGGVDLVGNMEQGTGLPSYRFMNIRHNDSRVRAFKSQLAQEGSIREDLIVMPCAARKNQVIRPVVIMQPDSQYFYKFLEPPPQYFLTVPKSAFSLLTEPLHKSHVLLLWKSFDGEKLSILSFTSSPDRTGIEELIPKVLEHANQEAKWKDVSVLEEFAPRKLVSKELSATINEAKLASGDIMVVYAPEHRQQLEAYYARLYNVVHVQLCPLDDESRGQEIMLSRQATIDDVYSSASHALNLPLNSFRLITSSVDEPKAQLSYPLTPDPKVRFFDPFFADRYHFYVLFYQPNQLVTESIVVYLGDQSREIRFDHAGYAGKSVSSLAGVFSIDKSDHLQLWVLFDGKDIVHKVLRAECPVPTTPGRFVLASISEGPKDAKLLIYKLSGAFGFLWVAPGTTASDIIRELNCERIMAYDQATGLLRLVLLADTDVHGLLTENELFFECVAVTTSPIVPRSHSPSTNILYSPSLRLKK